MNDFPPDPLAESRIAGVMAESIVAGLLNEGIVRRDQLVASHPREDCRLRLSATEYQGRVRILGCE